MKQVSTFKLSMNLLNTNNCKSCFYDSSAKCPCCQDHEEILDVHRTVPFETMIIGKFQHQFLCIQWKAGIIPSNLRVVKSSVLFSGALMDDSWYDTEVEYYLSQDIYKSKGENMHIFPLIYFANIWIFNHTKGCLPNTGGVFSSHFKVLTSCMNQTFCYRSKLLPHQRILKLSKVYYCVPRKISYPKI